LEETTDFPSLILDSLRLAIWGDLGMEELQTQNFNFRHGVTKGAKVPRRPSRMDALNFCHFTTWLLSHENAEVFLKMPLPCDIIAASGHDITLDCKMIS
jgi:hypothetical protein